MKNPFIGAGVALVTPFNENHTIDYDALRKLVRYQIDNGIDFLVVQGTTGESPVLSMDEKLEVLSIVQSRIPYCTNHPIFFSLSTASSCTVTQTT